MKIDQIDFSSLSYQILQLAHSGITRTYFLRKISNILLNCFKCTEVILLLKVPNDQTRFELIQHTKKTFNYYILSSLQFEKNSCTHDFVENNGTYGIWKDILQGNFDSSSPFFTAKGSFRTNSSNNTSLLNKEISVQESTSNTIIRKKYKSLVMIPFLFSDERIGLMQLKNIKQDLFLKYKIELVEDFAQTLGVIMLNQYTQAALQERVKELTCLYGMSQISEQIDISLEDLLYRIMELIPPAWQYPEFTRTRIILDGIDYSNPDSGDGRHKLVADIDVNGEKRGVIEVIYIEKCPELDEGAFLKEERKLIDTIANELAIIIKRRYAEEEKINLKNKLHHADRLATVGELAAGVAHELNEPLGSIMGFAQLAGKCPDLPKQAEMDLEKIVKSSLHAREIIKKLMSFARKTQPEKKKIDINLLVEEGMYFFKSRCSKEGIILSVSLEPNLPYITADPVQINQIMVNIIVNAMQAMPKGGKLDIETHSTDGDICLLIKDTGHGMSEDVKERIFDPFFTTKGAGKGIGLGLSVVQGIVNSHKGKIIVESEAGKGTQFEIKLPIAISHNKGTSD